MNCVTSITLLDGLMLTIYTENNSLTHIQLQLLE